MDTPAQLIKLLEAPGLDSQNLEFLDSQDTTLRGEWVARPWVNKDCGHGILDTRLLEEESRYSGEWYRKQFFPKVNSATKHSHHLKRYKDINLAQFRLIPREIGMRTQSLGISLRSLAPCSRPLG